MSSSSYNTLGMSILLPNSWNSWILCSFQVFKSLLIQMMSFSPCFLVRTLWVQALYFGLGSFPLFIQNEKAKSGSLAVTTKGIWLVCLSRPKTSVHLFFVTKSHYILVVPPPARIFHVVFSCLTLLPLCLPCFLLPRQIGFCPSKPSNSSQSLFSHPQLPPMVGHSLGRHRLSGFEALLEKCNGPQQQYF